MHSPASFDFGAEEGKIPKVKTSYREWLLAIMRSKLDAVVIADHNTHLGIDQAREQLDILRQEAVNGILQDGSAFHEVSILSGVELTVDGGFHLIAVFDVDTPSEVVNGLLHNCGYKAERGDSNGTTSMSFELVADQILSNGGLAIPAHADLNAGLFSHDARNQRSIVDSGQIVAAEVLTPNGTEKALKNEWVPVLGSDAHHLDGANCPPNVVAKYPGSHFTYVKMETPNLTGIKLALADGPTSVVPSLEGMKDPNHHTHSTVEGLDLTHNGHKTEYRFSPWMNAVIGGRGVGKSTLIELVRLALGRYMDQPAELQASNTWFSPEPARQGSARFWNNTTSVEVYLRRNGLSYKVEWSGNRPSESRVYSLQEDGWQAEGGNPRDRFPLLINSQKQIFETARDASSLLAVLDQHADVDRSTWQRQFNESCDIYRSQNASLQLLKNQIQEEPHLRGVLADVEAELARIARVRDSKEAKELDSLLETERCAEKFESGARQAEEDLKAFLVEHAELVPDTGADENLSGKESPSDPSDEYDSRQAAVVKAMTAVKEAQTLFATSRASWEASRPASKRLARIEVLRIALKPDDATDENATEGVSSRTEHLGYEQLADRRGSIQDSLEKVAKAKKDYQELSDKLSKTYQSIVEMRNALTKKHQDLIAKLCGGELKLTVLPMGEVNSLENTLRSITRKSSSFDSAFASLIEILGHEFAPGRDKRLALLKEIIKDVHLCGAESPVLKKNKKVQLEGRFIKHLTGLTTSDLEQELALWFPEDRIRIQYKHASDMPWQEIDHASPGQKTAALLSLVLQLSDDPLFLDQPEDDLDNKLIYDLVVSTLKRIKTERQVVVVTHNANVVVNADAEHVTVLEHGHVPRIETSGGIQNANVKNSICLIMEGGESAFEQRYRRLMPNS